MRPVDGRRPRAGRRRRHQSAAVRSSARRADVVVAVDISGGPTERGDMPDPWECLYTTVLVMGNTIVGAQAQARRARPPAAAERRHLPHARFLPGERDPARASRKRSQGEAACSSRPGGARSQGEYASTVRAGEMAISRRRTRLTSPLSGKAERTASSTPRAGRTPSAAPPPRSRRCRHRPPAGDGRSARQKNRTPFSTAPPFGSAAP